MAFDFGEAVRKRRTWQGKTQAQLGELVGMKASAISRMERDCGKKIHLSTAYKVAQALGYTLDEMIYDTHHGDR